MKKIILKSVILVLTLQLFYTYVHSQPVFKVMPLGNSITYDTAKNDTRPIGDRVSYRYKLYQKLTAGSYNFDFVGSQSGGGNFLPVGYREHAGFPGITTNGLLNLLQSGIFNSECKLPSCPQSYLSYYNPDIIFLHIGTNGLTSNADALSFRNDVESILNVIDNYEASANKIVTVFLCQIVNRVGGHAPTTEYNNLLSNLVLSRPSDNIELVNMATGAGINYAIYPVGDMRDTIHPDTSGYRKMGEKLYSAIQSYNFKPVLQPATFSINENSLNETSVGTVTAYDFNPGSTISYSIVSSSPSGAFSINSSTGAITVSNSLLLDYETNPVFSITVRATSNGSLSDEALITINLNNVNEIPKITDTSLDVSFSEGGSGTQLFSGLSISDDGLNISSATLTFGSGYSSSEDVYNFSLTGGINGTLSGNTLSFSNVSSIANYISVLKSITYSNSSENPSVSNRVITLTVNDGANTSEGLTKNIYVSTVNDPPVLSGIEGTALNYVKGTGPVSITSLIAVTDVDNTTLNYATISISSNYQSNQDVLGFTNNTLFSGTWNSGTGTLTLTPVTSATVAQFQTALRAVTYTNTRSNPNSSIRQVSFRVHDGYALSNTEVRSITFATNSAPVLGNFGSDFTFTEGGIATPLGSGVTITDADDVNMSSATITFTSGYQPAEDVLTYTLPSGISLASATGGVFTFEGSSSKSNYESLLRSIQYRNSSENPSTTTRTITVVVNDGVDPSNTLIRNISIIAVNDGPVLSGVESSNLAFTEGGLAVPVSNNIVVADSDNTNVTSATIAITSGYQSGQDILIVTSIPAGASGSFNTTTGIFTISGSSLISNYQNALRSITYQNTGDNPAASKIITFMVNDGAGWSNMAVRNVSVTGVNDLPVLDNIEIDPLYYDEGAGKVIISSSITVTDVDNANLATATISIGTGHDSTEDSLFFTNTAFITGNFNRTTGVLTLTGPAPVSTFQAALRNVSYKNIDTLNPSATPRLINFTIRDSTGASNLKQRYIFVTPINDPPAATGVSIAGSNTIFTNLNGTFTYTDPEGNGPGTHIYRWYRASLSSKADSAMITGESTSNYLLQYIDGGKYIRFKVMPRDNQNALAPVYYVSPWLKINAAPIASALQIGGLIGLGQTDTAKFTYSDPELNPQNVSGSVYIWYRANDAAGTGKVQVGTQKTYTIASTDESKYISFAVAPAATTGSLIGDTVQSVWYGPISHLPTLTLSGTDTICPGELASIRLITTGEAPKTVTYAVGTTQYVVGNIVSTDTIIRTSVIGTYTPKKISDKKYANGIVNGSAVITRHDTVKVSLSAVGSTVICEDGVATANLRADFTGTSPWKFVLTRNAQDTSYTNVTTDPFNFYVKKQGIYSIKSVSDKYCTGVVKPGTISVSYKDSIVAVISGIDTICPGGTARLTVTKTYPTTTAPWSFTYTVNGANPITVNNITGTTYNLAVSAGGIYRISNVCETTRTRKGRGEGRVVVRTAPTAIISGTSTICENSNATLSVSLTGVAPWRFKYKRDGVVADSISDVLSSTKTITVNKEAVYTLAEVYDKYCKGNVSGSATVSVISAPDIQITGLKPAYSRVDDGVPVFGVPSGGTFIGNGLIRQMTVPDTTFFYPWKAGVGTHLITYNYQDISTGCWGTEDTIVRVMEAKADIFFPGHPNEKKFFCYNDSIFTILGGNVANDIGSFVISGGSGFTDNGDNTATIDPSKFLSGTYEVTYTYFDEIELSISETFQIEVVPLISIIGFNKVVFCNNEPSVDLNGNISSGIFSGKAVFGNKFVPSYALIGKDTIFYTLTTTAGCKRQVIKEVTINETPQVMFTVPDTCVFPGTTNPTIFVNNTVSSDSVKSWLWNFGDVESGGFNTSSLENPVHLYKKSGSHVISLTATSVNNCVAMKIEDYNFGDKPVADFTWNTECFQTGSPIQFSDSSKVESGSISGRNWKFFKENGYDSRSSKDVVYNYKTPGEYKVQLKVTSSYGCSDSISRVFPLRPNYNLANGIYFEDFETGRNGWSSDSAHTSEINNWTFGEPGYPGAASGDYGWFTKIEDHGKEEQSWIVSPCFDFSGLSKPMIRFNTFRRFDQVGINPVDGAVIQYTVDNGKTWSTLGNIDDGVNWYNKFGPIFLPDRVGWAAIIDTKWMEARHNLNDVVGKKNVQFRIFYGSTQDARENEGLIIDDVWVGNRQKIILLEHFTDAFDLISAQSDSLLKQVVSQYPRDVFDVHFHTNLVGANPLSNDVSGARLFFYGIDEVPYTLMDGGNTAGKRFDFVDKKISANDLNIQSLYDPLFKIKVTTTNNGNYLNINTEISSIKTISKKELIVHLLVLEREVTGIDDFKDIVFRNVIKAMVPNSAGTYFFRSWEPGEKETLSNSWVFENVFDADQLRVIAFVQDVQTGEIYQAAIDISDFPSSIDRDSDEEFRFKIYPNPASEFVYIRLNKPAGTNNRIMVYNSAGMLVHSMLLETGTDEAEINIYDFKKGLYFIRLLGTNQVLGIQKLIIAD